MSKAKTLNQIIDEFFESSQDKKELGIVFTEKIEIDETEYKQLFGHYILTDFITGSVNIDVYYIINKGYIEVSYWKTQKGTYRLISIHAFKHESSEAGETQ